MHGTINSTKEFEPDELILLEWRKFKTLKIQKDCMRSLAILPPRIFSAGEIQYLV